MVTSQSDTSRPTQAPRDALTIIRSATTPCHVSLEKEIDWPTAFSSPSQYTAFLQGFLRVVEPLEDRLAKFEPAANAGVSHDRSCRLRRDIAAVQQSFGGNALVGYGDHGLLDVGFVLDRTTALGALYVLEGSALGGQILSKQVRECAAQWTLSALSNTTQLHDLPTIDSYFLGRGAETGAHWRAFCQRINHELPDPESASIAARAAVKTFELFYLSLTGKRLCVRP